VKEGRGSISCYSVEWLIGLRNRPRSRPLPRPRFRPESRRRNLPSGREQGCLRREGSCEDLKHQNSGRTTGWAGYTTWPIGNRSHLIKRRRWRGERFWPDARRDAGRIPAAGCYRGTTTQPGKRSTAPFRFLQIHFAIRGSNSSFPQWVTLSGVQADVAFVSIRTTMMITDLIFPRNESCL
jgi:hypothetical protein